jgi:hypothetical protein
MHALPLTPNIFTYYQLIINDEIPSIDFLLYVPSLRESPTYFDARLCCLADNFMETSEPNVLSTYQDW